MLETTAHHLLHDELCHFKGYIINSQDIVNVHPPATDILASIAVESLTKLQNTIKENDSLLSFSLSRSLAEFDSRHQLWSHEDQTLYSIEIINLTRSLTSYPMPK